MFLHTHGMYFLLIGQNSFNESPMNLTYLSVLIIFSCCVFVWISRISPHQYLFIIETDDSINHLSSIIRQQSGKYPKVFFRCFNDDSALNLPRYASDDLTEIVMGTSDECGDNASDALLMVHTATTHFERRRKFRQFYADYRNTQPYKLKLERENMIFGDTIVGAFLDTYHNLSLKAVMGYRWLTETCPYIKLLIKMDDDVFFDVPKFFNKFWPNIPENRRHNTFHCLVWHNATVGRFGKWKVGRRHAPNATYAFPYCAGFVVIVSTDLIRHLYQKGRSIDFFWIDDVFLYGMVPTHIPEVNFTQIGLVNQSITTNYTYYKKCRETEKDNNCSLWATLTDGAKELDTELHSMPSRGVKQNVLDKDHLLGSHDKLAT